MKTHSILIPYFSSWFVFVLILVGGYAQGEDVYPLNGFWKFNTFLGEGSNYLDIKIEPTDIVIDNSQVEFLKVNGTWNQVTTAARNTACWESNYLRRYFKGEVTDSSCVRFKTDGLETGYYEHFIFYPWSHHPTTQIYVKHARGIYEKDISQRNRPSKWLSLGIFKLVKGRDSYVEFTAHTQGTVSADAIMLRPVNSETIAKARRERNQAHLPVYDDKNWQLLKVPGHWGMINKYANYTGKGWYRKTFSLPTDWTQESDSRFYLQFEGVYHLAKVYLNGTFIGKNQGGFTPFELDVTDYLDLSGPNVIAVEADNNYLVGATWNWGGIIREVNLVRHKDVRISHQYIHAEPNLQTGTATYQILTRIENNSSSPRSLEIEAKILKGSLLNRSTMKVQIPSHSMQEIWLRGQLTAEQVQLWHFDQPELYDLITTLTEENQELHLKKVRFGIRKFEATATQMLLNGEPVRLVGFNRVSDHRYWGSSEPQELINFDVDMMKEAGANMMRIMHGTQNKKLLDRCDERGILIVEEVNVRELRNTELSPPDYPRAKQWLKAMVERDINHPCIVGWSVGNELVDHFHYVKSMYAYTKRLDPYRMALHVSNQGYKKGESPQNNPLTYGDMIFQNIYQPDPGKVMDTLHARWPDKAIFFSEFGIGRFTTPDLDHDIPRLGPWYDYLRGQRPYTAGASIWTYNDYKSGYAFTLPSENRAWGMVNAWRTKRRSFYRHRIENSPLKKMEIKQIDLAKRKAVVSLFMRKADGFPSYTLKNYTLKYTFKDKSGSILLSKEIPLPTLTPGIAPWIETITWDAFKGAPYLLQVALTTPNGYNRHDKITYFGLPDQPTIDAVQATTHKIRVHFTRQKNTREYQLRYTLNGKEALSPKTIANYLELDSLPTGTKVTLQLIASNGAGESKASKALTIKVQGQSLAPIIWDSFITDNKLVVGYSGAWEDQYYTVRYGDNPKALHKEVSTNGRGMMTIDLDGYTQVYYQLRRTTPQGESQWSPVVRANAGTCRIYE